MEEKEEKHPNKSDTFFRHLQDYLLSRERSRRRTFEARKARNSKSERTDGADDEEWKFAHLPDIDFGLGQVRESDYYPSGVDNVARKQWTITVLETQKVAESCVSEFSLSKNPTS